MITYYLLYFIYIVIYGIIIPIRILPDVSLPADINNAIASVSAYLGALEPVFPIGTLLAILGLYLTIEGFIFGYKAVMWIIRRLPTQS